MICHKCKKEIKTSLGGIIHCMKSDDTKYYHNDCRELKIEVGKYYRTRQGFKARIYATDIPGSWPIHGAIIDNHNRHMGQSWRQDGKAFEENEDHIVDIVSKWEEPKEKRIAYVNRETGNIKLIEHGYEPYLLNADDIRVPHLDEP